MRSPLGAVDGNEMTIDAGSRLGIVVPMSATIWRTPKRSSIKGGTCCGLERSGPATIATSTLPTLRRLSSAFDCRRFGVRWRFIARLQACPIVHGRGGFTLHGRGRHGSDGCIVSLNHDERIRLKLAVRQGARGASSCRRFTRQLTPGRECGRRRPRAGARGLPRTPPVDHRVGRASQAAPGCRHLAVA